MAKIWHSIEIECDPSQADAIGSFLLDRGAPGLLTDERGDRVAVTGHFENPPGAAEIDAFLDHVAETSPGVTRPRPRCSTIEESNWAENWKEHFPPLEIGERLLVHPPWTSDVPRGRIGVALDPGMAFGTGHHGSTRGCLAALDAIVQPDRAPVVLDLGTGSGVLAIAAVKLGATSALAVDIDPEACAIAAVNARANQVDDRIEVANELAPGRTDFDIVVANIFSGMLIGFANDIVRRLKDGGYAIGAGLETPEAPSVSQAWSAAGMTPETTLEVEGWSTLVFRKPDAEAS